MKEYSSDIVFAMLINEYDMLAWDTIGMQKPTSLSELMEKFSKHNGQEESEMIFQHQNSQRAKESSKKKTKEREKKWSSSRRQKYFR